MESEKKQEEIILIEEQKASSIRKDGESLLNWIRVYDDIISDEMCENCIEFIENAPQESVKNYNAHYLKRKEVAVFNYGSEKQQEIFKNFSEITRKVFEKYRTDLAEFGGPGSLGSCNLMEAPNIVKYVPDAKNPDKFDIHADAFQAESATRQLSLLFYFNTVKEGGGGGTTFPFLKKSVSPKKGRVLVFPSSFMYMHTGDPVVSQEKYAAVVWIHFNGTFAKPHYSTFPF